MLSLLIFAISFNVLALKFISFQYEEVLNRLNVLAGIDICTSYSFLELDMLHDFSWISSFTCDGYRLNDLFLKDSQCEIEIEKNVMVVTNTLRGNLAFREEGGTINNVTLYYVNQRAGGFFDTIGLAYKITNPERSFIMTLKNNNIIDKMGFGFFHNMKDITSKGELVFGEVPEKYYKDRYSFSCRINDKKEVWGCGISGLSINNNEFKFTANKVYGVFQSHSINISVPPKVFHWITDEVFSKYINDKKCVLYRYYISCFENQLDDFKGVSIIIGNIKFTLQKRQVFIFTGLMSNFAIRMDEQLQDDEWIIGVPLIKYYETYYDYENKAITFYSDTPFELINGVSMSESVKVYYFIVIVISIAASIVMLYVRRKRTIEEEKKKTSSY